MRLLYTFFAFAALSFASPLSDALDTDAAEEYELAIRDDVFKNPPVCHDGSIHVIGCGGNAGTNKGLGLLESTVKELQETFHNSKHTYSVPYPKGNPDANFSMVTMIGVDHLTKYLQYYTAGCPNTPLVLLGYSLGAIVTMNTLCGRSHEGAPYSQPLPAKFAKYIIATVVYGDETRIPGQPYNLGTCTTGHGVDPRQNPAGCDAFENNFQSYCDAPDPECCGGNNSMAHYVYAHKYNSDAIDFIIDRYDTYYGSK